MDRFLSTGQVSRLCGVSPVTVAKWVDRGSLQGHVTPGGHRRVTVDDLIGFLKRYRMKVPRELERDAARRILVADPNERFRELLAKAARTVSPNCPYRSVASGTRALVLVGSWRPDVLLLGLALEDIDPLEACRRLADIPENAATVMAVVTREIDEHTTMGLEARMPVVLVPRSKIMADPESFLQELVALSCNGRLSSDRPGLDTESCRTEAA